MSAWPVSKNLIIATAILAAAPLFAQEDPDKAAASGKTGYINLSVGIYQDEKMEDLPAQIELKGTFRYFTSVQWNPETHTMRFVPNNPGVGTLIIRHPKTQDILGEYHIDVRKTDLQKVARELQSLLQGIEG